MVKETAIPGLGCPCQCNPPDQVVKLSRRGNAENRREYPLRCSCLSCGPDQGNGQRCTIRVAPVVRQFNAVARGHWSNLVFCEDCIGHNRLAFAKAAASRAREERRNEYNYKGTPRNEKPYRERSRSRDTGHPS